MKVLFKQDYIEPLTVEMDLADESLTTALKKTRLALDAAYAGFDNATEFDMIDSYIYEINALQRRYKHLSDLAEKEGLPDSSNLHKHTSVGSWVAHIFSKASPAVGKAGVHGL